MEALFDRFCIAKIVTLLKFVATTLGPFAAESANWRHGEAESLIQTMVLYKSRSISMSTNFYQHIARYVPYKEATLVSLVNDATCS